MKCADVCVSDGKSDLLKLTINCICECISMFYFNVIRVNKVLKSRAKVEIVISAENTGSIQKSITHPLIFNESNSKPYRI